MNKTALEVITLEPKLQTSTLEELYKAILTLENVEECRRFFDDLCTVPELKALSQRFQVAGMLREGKVYSEIVAQTGASTATISRVNSSLNYGADGYTIVFSRIKK